MSLAEFVLESVTGLNTTMIDDVKDLTQEQAAWQPAPGAHPIAFAFWHFYRVQDDLVHSFQGKPSIWVSQKWYEKLGMDPKVNGGGFNDAQTKEVAARPLAELVEYARQVARASEDYFRSATDAELLRAPNPERPRRTIAVSVRAFLIAHGWWHTGEIKYLKGMQGMPFAY